MGADADALVITREVAMTTHDPPAPPRPGCRLLTTPRRQWVAGSPPDVPMEPATTGPSRDQHPARTPGVTPGPHGLTLGGGMDGGASPPVLL